MNMRRKKKTLKNAHCDVAELMRVPKARELEQSKSCSWSSRKKAESKECGEQRTTTSITVPISTKKDSIKIRKGAKRHSIVV